MNLDNQVFVQLVDEGLRQKYYERAPAQSVGRCRHTNFCSSILALLDCLPDVALQNLTGPELQ